MAPPEPKLARCYLIFLPAITGVFPALKFAVAGILGFSALGFLASLLLRLLSPLLITFSLRAVCRQADASRVVALQNQGCLTTFRQGDDFSEAKGPGAAARRAFEKTLRCLPDKRKEYGPVINRLFIIAGFGDLTPLSKNLPLIGSKSDTTMPGSR